MSDPTTWAKLPPSEPADEIRRLKDLLSFTSRPGAPQAAVRGEVSVREDGGLSACVTAPGADEERIGRILARHLTAAWKETGRNMLQRRIVAVVQPMFDKIGACKHLDDGEEGACWKCIRAAISNAAILLNEQDPDEDEAVFKDDAAAPAEAPESVTASAQEETGGAQ